MNLTRKLKTPWIMRMIVLPILVVTLVTILKSSRKLASKLNSWK